MQGIMEMMSQIPPQIFSSMCGFFSTGLDRLPFTTWRLET